jgi:anti-sigma28 factor (negative regulator of flagellin synthesis)
MTKQLFRVTLDVDAENLANLMIDYGDFLRDASKIVEDGVPARLRAPNKAPIVSSSATLRMTTKTPSFTAKSLRVTHAAVAKAFAGRQSIRRHELIEKIKPDLVQGGFQSVSATPCVSQLIKTGYIQVVK